MKLHRFYLKIKEINIYLTFFIMKECYNEHVRNEGLIWHQLMHIMFLDNMF